MSEKYPPGDRQNHDNFCTIEKWQLVSGAAGKPVKHHKTYELSLWDGRILRTRISRPINSSEYGPKLWSHILKFQLEVTAREFWACVKEKQLPIRQVAQVIEHPKAIPLFLVRELTALGVEEEKALSLSASEAAQLRDDLLRQQS